MKIIFSLLAGAFIVLRFLLPSSGLNGADVFKDLAHVFVGGLFGAGIVGLFIDFKNQPNLTSNAVTCLLLAVLLTFAEVVAFFTRG